MTSTIATRCSRRNCWPGSRATISWCRRRARSSPARSRPASTGSSTRANCRTAITSTRASWHWSPAPIPAMPTACPISGASPASATMWRWSGRRSATRRRSTAGPCCSIPRTRRSSPRAASRCSTRRRRCSRRRSPISGSIRRAMTEGISTRPSGRSPTSARTSASSIPRNTSTISPMAISACRSAIRAMLSRRATAPARPRTASRSPFACPGGGADRRSTCSASRPMRRTRKTRCGSSTISCAREVIAAITDAVSYPNPNLPGTALVVPAIRDDPAVYPPERVRAAVLCRPAGARRLRAGPHPRSGPGSRSGE